MAFHGRVFDWATPTPASRYLMFPTLAGVAGGTGALLISIVNQMPPHIVTYSGFGWGMIFFANTLFVSIYSIGNERAAYFAKQAELEAHKPYPELPPYAQEVEAIEPEPRGSKNGFLTCVVTDEDTGTGADLFTPTVALWRLARYGGADQNKPLSEGEWTGSGKPFSVAEFRALRDWMIEQGLAWWKNANAHSQGWTIRPRARAILRGLSKIEHFAPPLLNAA